MFSCFIVFCGETFFKMLLSVQNHQPSGIGLIVFYSFFRVQIKMSAPTMKQMNVTPKPFVPILKGRMSVAVSVDIREMVETARVNIFSFAVH